MSEKEKDIMGTIEKAIPKMSEFDKGYFLARAEAALEKKERDDGSKEQEQNTA